MGLNVQDVFQQDPEMMARRLYMQQWQQANPSGSAAGAIGAILGRGLGNVQQGRGFFDVADPALQRVTDIQRIYNQAMQGIDPNDPKSVASGLTSLSSQLAAAGYAPQAMMAAKEALKYAGEQRAEARAEEQLDISRERLAIDKGRLDKPEFQQVTGYTAADGSALSFDKNSGKYFDKDGKEYKGNLVPKPSALNPVEAAIASRMGGGGDVVDKEGDQQSGSAMEKRARQEFEARVKKERAASQRGAGQPVAEIDPFSGETVFRLQRGAAASPEQIGAMSRQELQEYYRSGKIPQRLIGM